MSRFGADIRELLAAGSIDEAVAAYAELLATEESVRVYRLGGEIARALRQSQTIRVRVLRTFTAEPLMDAVRARAVVSHLGLDISLAGYDQLEQESLAETIDERCDAVIIAARLADLVPGLGRGFAALATEAVSALSAEVIDRAGGWLDGLRRRFPRAHLVLLGFARPAPTSYGLADPAVEIGHRRAVARINEAIAARCRQLPGAVFVDVDAVVSAVGTRRAFDARMDAVARQPLSAEGIAALSAQLARVLAAAFTPRRKCLVLDADNTLWGGIIGEDGIDGIALGPGYPGAGYLELQRAVLDLASRGVLLALASKNNEADVLEVLDHHRHQVLRRQHFAAWRIDWRDKVTALREIAAELGIDTAALVLVDDSDFECALVRRQMPEVEVLQAPAEPLELAAAIDGLWSLDAVDVSDVDRARGPMYRARAERERARGAAASLEEFLASLEQVLTIEPVSAATAERASQLSMRTNQLNATARRYSAADIARMLEAADRQVFQVRLADRFGDSGICGLAILAFDDAGAAIDTLLLSCRVIGRGVEDAVVAFLERRARAAGSASLRATYVKTPKNQPVAALFDRLGYERDGISGDCAEIGYRRELGTVREFPPWFTLNLLPGCS